MRINSKKVFIGAMLLSAALGGVAGCIEVLGVHGYYLDGFARDLGTNGMLAALIVKSNMLFTPFVAFFLAVLKAGAMAMKEATSRTEIYCRYYLCSVYYYRNNGFCH